ncbi:MAG: UDP-N-acetylmuramoyl-L-alanine--D-glutamate ligase [Chloroflexi bacterium]|nr:UDP-N-acetylmuramoyl-L-alanine--D-glutamate ligase [Chloroflexota bacterium]
MQKRDGEKVVILGAGRQGQALAIYFSRANADVTLSDIKPADHLQSEFNALADYPIHWVTGSHPLSLLDSADGIYVSGGADLKIDFIQQAMKRGIPVKNDTELFLENVTASIIGITGSSGKTTTTTLVGRIAERAAAPGQNVWVGGNIGNPLLTLLDQIKPHDIVVLELSSFQLELTQHSPQIAAILNITPNHLDRHGTMEAYVAAKRNLLAYQTKADKTVLNREDHYFMELQTRLPSQVISFGMARGAETVTAQVFFEGAQLLIDNGSDTIPVLLKSEISLRGQHNLMNVLAACAISFAAGFPVEAMRAGIIDFQGVAHRLQLVREKDGVRWYDDSIATAPERALAALNSFDEPVIMLLGGRDKKLPWTELVAALHHKAKAAVLFGEAADMIENALADEDTGSPLIVRKAKELEEAVSIADKLAVSGDVVLLSPGGTSYDAYRDFEERGKAFVKWVHTLI